MMYVSSVQHPQNTTSSSDSHLPNILQDTCKLDVEVVMHVLKLVTTWYNTSAPSVEIDVLAYHLSAICKSLCGLKVPSASMYKAFPSPPPWSNGSWNNNIHHTCHSKEMVREVFPSSNDKKIIIIRGKNKHIWWERDIHVFLSADKWKKKKS